MVQTNLSLNGEMLIQGFEGFCLSFYADSKGYPTVGYGHLITSKETFAKNKTGNPNDSVLTKAHIILHTFAFSCYNLFFYLLNIIQQTARPRKNLAVCYTCKETTQMALCPETKLTMIFQSPVSHPLILKYHFE